MSNVDIEIYVSQLINFFESNPNDLIDLVGNIQKEEFYLMSPMRLLQKSVMLSLKPA